MPIEKLPSGTRGRAGAPRLLTRLMTPLMLRLHRRQGDRFAGMDLLYLRTVGAKSGQRRTTPVARFEDGTGAWLVVASANGSAHHPAWYLNIVAHPDEVAVELGGATHPVSVEQLDGPERAKAWRRIVARSPRFADYETTTDRLLPVLRLRPRDAAADPGTAEAGPAGAGPDVPDSSGTGAADA